jgi:hypothetical protein
MKSVLASYRWRRRLAWSIGAAAAIGAAVSIALIWPNTAPEEKLGARTPLKIDNRPLKPVRLKARERASALAVVGRFLDTAVARKNVDRAWSLVAPEFRAGITRRQWDAGTMPIVPYPVLSARWRVEYSDVQGVGFSLALFPKKGSHERAQVFLIGLHKIGIGKRRHWVVDDWHAAPSSGAQSAAGGGPGVLEQVSPKTSGGHAKESAAWLLLPVGLLSLILIIPLGIAAANWYRARRAEAMFGR